MDIGAGIGAALEGVGNSLIDQANKKREDAIRWAEMEFRSSEAQKSRDFQAEQNQLTRDAASGTLGYDDIGMVEIKGGKATRIRNEDGSNFKGTTTKTSTTDFQRKMDELKKLGMTAEEQKAFILGAKPMDRATAERLAQNYAADQTKSSFGPTDTEKYDELYKTKLEELLSFTPAGASTKGAEASAGKPKPADLIGGGTKTSPFKATSQAHIDWFKENAASGTVIEVEGKKFTK